MIASISLTKRYGEIAAVQDLSFDVQPGVVTGFLGADWADQTHYSTTNSTGLSSKHLPGRELISSTA